MQLFEKWFKQAEAAPRSPELTQFAQFLVDNTDVQVRVLDYAEFLQNRYGEYTYEDRKIITEGDDLVKKILIEANIELPTDVTLSVFLTELLNRISEGEHYVPTWLRDEEDDSLKQVA